MLAAHAERWRWPGVIADADGHAVEAYCVQSYDGCVTCLRSDFEQLEHFSSQSNLVFGDNHTVNPAARLPNDCVPANKRFLCRKVAPAESVSKSPKYMTITVRLDKQARSTRVAPGHPRRRCDSALVI